VFDDIHVYHLAFLVRVQQLVLFSIPFKILVMRRYEYVACLEENSNVRCIDRPTTAHCVMTQKNAVLSYFAAEA
jgi:hypothetical protein